MTHPTTRILASGSVALLLATTLVAMAAPPASATTRNVNCTDTALQPAIDAANAGDVLVIEGRCLGNFVIEKDLALVGPAILDGEDAASTLTVGWDVTVDVLNLTITNGRGLTPEWGGPELGGGITNYGTLVLRGQSSVLRNSGRGIMNEGTLTMRGSAVVRRNSGGGIANWRRLTMNGVSSVRGNTTSAWGAGIFSYNGVTVMNNWSSVRANSSSFGGGVWIHDAALVMNDFSTVTRNRSDSDGGGVWIHYSSVSMNGSASVTGNVAMNHGGGIDSDGYVTLNDAASVSANKARAGAGLINWGGGEMTLNDRSSVRRNEAQQYGAGIYNGGCTDEVGPTVTVNDSSVIRGNVVGTQAQPGYGAAIYSYVEEGDPSNEYGCNGITHLTSGRIVRNHALGGGSGGGVFGPIASRGDGMVIRRNTPNNCDPPC
jgi:hypothetical protein